MNISDGICKLCNASLENLEHMFYSCCKLSQVWLQLHQLVKQALDIEIELSYKEIILGVKVGNMVRNHVINMLISMLKWEIWLRRNEFVFENTFKTYEIIQKTFRYKIGNHCKTLILSESVHRKLNGLKECLSNSVESLFYSRIYS